MSNTPAIDKLLGRNQPQQSATPEIDRLLGRNQPQQSATPAIDKLLGRNQAQPTVDPARTDYPEMPLSEQGFTGIGQSLLTSDPQERQKLLLKSEPERYKGFTRPITEAEKEGTKVPNIFLDDKEYLVLDRHTGETFSLNKPGFSEQDLNDFIAQGIAFTPAGIGAKMLSRGIASRVLATGATSAGTDVAQQEAVRIKGGKEEINPYQTVFTGVTPFVGRGISNLIGGARQRIMEHLGKTDPVPYTRGQMTGDPRQLGQEQFLRQRYPERFADTDFFDGRPVTLERAVEEGIAEKLPMHRKISQAGLGRAIRGSIRRDDEKAYKEVSDLYTQAREKGRGMTLKPDVGTTIKDKLKAQIGIEDGSDLDKALNRFSIKLDSATIAGKDAPRDLVSFEEARKELNNLINEAERAGRTGDVAQLTQFKKGFDDYFDNATWFEYNKLFDNIDLTNDRGAIDAFKKARKSFNEYAKVFKNENIEKLYNVMEKTDSPEEVILKIMGVGQSGSTPMSKAMIKAVKEAGGTDATYPLMISVVRNIFYDAKRGSGVLKDPKQIRKAYDNMFEGRGATAMKELFGADFRKELSTTVNRISREPDFVPTESWIRQIPIFKQMAQQFDVRQADNIINEALYNAGRMPMKNFGEWLNAVLAGQAGTVSQWGEQE